ncbi:MAG: beta strand repeat-containing protein, partial [Acidimicrobiales bacterium]
VITNTSVDVGKGAEFAAARSATLLDGHVFGGLGALPNDVLDQITAAARAEGAIPPAPTVVAIAPTAGPSGGGTPFTVTGTNLATTSVIDFCGVSTTTFTATATAVTGTTPARPNGPCFVNVSAAGGSAGVTFTYTGGPSIGGIAPSGGPVAGGTTFTISGTNLAATTSVDFCGAVATSVSATSTTVTGMTPARAAGACTVTLTTPGGTAVTTFSYGSSATITSISPLTGPVTGGTGFTVTGTNLAGTTAVDFCGAAATSVGSSATTVTGITPARSAGACTVTVLAPGGSVTTTFTYGSGPAITSITPASGPTTGGTNVTIVGANLGGATAVDFCGSPATNVVPSASTIGATTPAHAAGGCTVTVTTPSGTATTTFTFGAAPDATSITPTSGTVAGGTNFTIAGTNLGGTTSVSFCGAAATNVIVNAAGTSITGTTPARPVGACTVTVTTAGGSDTIAFAYTDVPDVTGISPSQGSMLGGTAYTITGVNFIGTTAVNFCGSNSTFTVNAGGTAISGTTPGRLLGFGACTVTVVTPGGMDTTSFNYTLL